jgi:hypothetical protein
MDKNDKFKISFGLALIFMLIGTILKIFHVNSASTIIVIGLLFTISYITIGVIQVNKSKKITRSKKKLWTIAFILFSIFTGLFYLKYRRTILAQRTGED